MPDDLTPTPDDYAVDPRTVLELAAKSTPGPWTPNVESDRGYCGPNDAYGRFYAPTFKEMPFTDFSDDQDLVEKQAKMDSEFLCMARTALPALARRVLAAEERSEDRDLALKNDGSDRTARVLLEIAETGARRGQCFGGESVEKAAQVILGLHAEASRLRTELAAFAREEST